MPEIIWIGIIKSEEDFPAADVPKNAEKLNVEEDIATMQIQALPFMLPCVLICLICMFAKSFLAHEKVIHVGFLLPGVVIGFFLIIAHELLHAVAFPKNAKVYIGIMPAKLTAVALSASPVKRNRYIFLSILPIMLGLIPLAIFCLSSNAWKEFNGLLFGMAIMGMTSVYPDIYHIYHVIRQVPANATIQTDKNTTYFFESQPIE